MGGAITKIVGGTDTQPNQYPFQALLRNRMDLIGYCGGIVIHNCWILTNVRCTIIQQPEDIIVTLGEHNKDTGDPISKSFVVDEIIRHEGYDPTKEDNDIALLKLSACVPYTDVIQPICLPFGLESVDFDQKTTKITGWGLTNGTDPNSVSSTLKQADMIYVKAERCRQAPFAWGSIITDNQFCGDGGGEKDRCEVDKGGPLFWTSPAPRAYFLGVTSYGFLCAEATLPSVYVKVVNYLDWIQNNTGLQEGSDFCVPQPVPSP